MVNTRHAQIAHESHLRAIEFIFGLTFETDGGNEGARANANFAAFVEQWGNEPYMLIDRIPDPVDFPAGMELRTQRSEPMLREFFRGLINALPIDAGFVDGMSKRMIPAIGRTRQMQPFVVYSDDQRSPVATALLMVGDPVAYLSFVATEPGYRRRGIGDAISRAAVSTAFESGASFVALDATPAGKRIYERMGFQTVGSYSDFATRNSAVDQTHGLGR